MDLRLRPRLALTLTSFYCRVRLGKNKFKRCSMLLDPSRWRDVRLWRKSAGVFPHSTRCYSQLLMQMLRQGVACQQPPKGWQLDLAPWWHPQWLATRVKAGKSAKEHQWHQETINIALARIFGGKCKLTRRLFKGSNLNLNPQATQASIQKRLMRVKKEYQRWQCKEVGSSLPGPCQAVGVLLRVWALVWLVVLPSPSLALFVAWNSAALGGESWEGSIEKDIERLIQHIYIYTYIYTHIYIYIRSTLFVVVCFVAVSRESFPTLLGHTVRRRSWSSRSSQRSQSEESDRRHVKVCQIGNL